MLPLYTNEEVDAMVAEAAASKQPKDCPLLSGTYVDFLSCAHTGEGVFESQALIIRATVTDDPRVLIVQFGFHLDSDGYYVWSKRCVILVESGEESSVIRMTPENYVRMLLPRLAKLNKLTTVATPTETVTTKKPNQFKLVVIDKLLDLKDEDSFSGIHSR